MAFVAYLFNSFQNYTSSIDIAQLSSHLRNETIRTLRVQPSPLQAIAFAEADADTIRVSINYLFIAFAITTAFGFVVGCCGKLFFQTIFEATKGIVYYGLYLLGTIILVWSFVAGFSQLHRL